jgi:Cd2+/Zn2+-exporting ATPase
MDSCASGGCPSCAAAARPAQAPVAAASAESRAETRRAFVVFGVAAVLWAAGFVLTLLDLEGRLRYAALAPLLASYALAGLPVLKAAVRNLLKGNALDENFLMAIATIGAFAVGEWEEAAGVMIFYMIGELAQEYAVNKSRRSIDSLLALKPDTARVAIGDGWEEVRAEEVAVGTVVLVRPGERIPLDGTVESGESFVDSSMLTGESVPRRAGPGDAVRSGTVATDGLLQVRTTRLAGESSAARIIELVENASSAKARTERFIAVFARWYTPAVVGTALLIAVVPPLVLPGARFADWLYRALIMLVISCPCALVVSIPLGYFGGIGGLSRRGILVKGAVFLDALAKVRRVAFDKTGTLTEGRFELRSARPAPGATIDADGLVALAAAAESHSNHPLARAVEEAAAARGLSPAAVDGAFAETAGRGISATVGGERVLVGSERLLSEAGIAVPETERDAEGLTNVYVARSGAYLGRLLVGDRAKAGAAAAVAELRALGVEQVALVSGDSAAAAARVGAELGIEEVYADLLPEGKLALVERWSAAGERTAFVGDGINDAPVLARSDVGIAMGSGADVAVEAADVIVMTDDPRRVPEAIRRSRRTRAIVFQNIVFALGVKGFFLTLGAFGVATMWEAVIADVGVALLAVLNSMRALR